MLVSDKMVIKHILVHLDLPINTVAASYYY